jgi:hypothetical protein
MTPRGHTMTPREVQEMIDRQIAALALGEGGKARLRASQAVDKVFIAAQVELHQDVTAA